MSEKRHIEICARNAGPISFTIGDEKEPRVINFDARDGIGFGLCDEDEANHLLGKIGGKAFFKPGAITVKGVSPKTPEQIEAKRLADEQAEAELAEAKRLADEQAEADRLGAEQADSDDPDGAQPDEELTNEVYDAMVNSNPLKKAMKEFSDAGRLKELIAHEANGRNRESWIAIMTERLSALTA
jgi:hypothetical protein